MKVCVIMMWSDNVHIDDYCRFSLQISAVSVCKRHEWPLPRALPALHLPQLSLLECLPAPLLGHWSALASNAPLAPFTLPPRSYRRHYPLLPLTTTIWIWFRSLPLYTALWLERLDSNQPSPVRTLIITVRKWTQRKRTFCKLWSSYWAQFPRNRVPLSLPTPALRLFPCILALHVLPPLLKDLAFLVRQSISFPLLVPIVNNNY